MTEWQIASAVQNYVTSHEGVTNFPASLEQIADEVDTMRGRIISELDRARQFTRPFLGYTQSAKILLSDKKKATVPRIYMLVAGHPAIAYAGGSAMKSPFKIVDGERRYTSTYDVYTHNYPTIWVGNGEIELLNHQADSIIISAVWEDPSALASYGYDYQNDDYPLPSGQIDMIIGKTAESYLRHMYRIFPQPNTQSDVPVGGGAGNVQGR